MKNRDNIILVVISNFFSIIVAGILGLLIPKYLGENYGEYANYKIYILYLGYATTIHLGVINGIYIKYGKQKYNGLLKDYSYSTTFNSYIIVH